MRAVGLRCGASGPGRRALNQGAVRPVGRPPSSVPVPNPAAARGGLNRSNGSASRQLAADLNHIASGGESSLSRRPQQPPTRFRPGH